MAGGNNNINRMSPRQRMINLMYIVLTAMLALNVSSDVLNGFRMVHDSLDSAIGSMTSKGEYQFQYLADLYAQNPEKLGPTFNTGKHIHDEANSLYLYIDELKNDIARSADGSDGNFHKLVNEDDLNASSEVMLNPVSRKGKKLRERIEAYTAMVLPQITDKNKASTIANLLSTKTKGAPWENKLFEGMPAVAAITMLSKLQYDIRVAESEAINSLIAGHVDFGGDSEVAQQAGLHINDLKAFVIPSATTVVQGGQYQAQIVLAAIDSVRKPSIYIGGARLGDPEGIFRTTAGSPGLHTISGYVEMLGSNGVTYKRDFTSQYTVVEPMVTISPTMMNVIYAGIDNPFSISAPGVPMDALSASMTNGTLTRNGNSWTARSTAIGSEAVISVSASVEGRTISLGSMKFRVRKLPDPSPYLAIGDNHYKGTPRRISKGALLGCHGVSAALEDDILQISYSVVSFQTVFFDQMGNAIPENSAGSQFSARQIEKFKQLKPGKTFFITNIKAKGPDGVVRDISPMEVGLN